MPMSPSGIGAAGTFLTASSGVTYALERRQGAGQATESFAHNHHASPRPL